MWKFSPHIFGEYFLKLGVFPKYFREFSKTIMEIFFIYFWGTFPKNREFPKLLWNFPSYTLGNISWKYGISENYFETSSNIFWEILHIKLGNFPNILKKISSIICMANKNRNSMNFFYKLQSLFCLLIHIFIDNKNQIINFCWSLQHFVLIFLPWHLWLIFDIFHFSCVLGWDWCLRTYLLLYTY